MYFLYVVFVLLMIYADRLTKWLATVNLKNGAGVSIIPRVLELTYTENTGAAWGMLKNHRWVFLVVSTAAIICLICFLAVNIRKCGKLMTFSLCLIIAGGIGNMIDRVLLGYVVDFIYVSAIDFPVFNFADICITVGAGLLLLWLILGGDLTELIPGGKGKKNG